MSRDYFIGFVLFNTFWKPHHQTKRYSMNQSGQRVESSHEELIWMHTQIWNLKVICSSNLNVWIFPLPCTMRGVLSMLTWSLSSPYCFTTAALRIPHWDKAFQTIIQLRVFDMMTTVCEASIDWQIITCVGSDGLLTPNSLPTFDHTLTLTLLILTTSGMKKLKTWNRPSLGKDLFFFFF